jgi:O-antigen/teichoic acid export membrane protein
MNNTWKEKIICLLSSFSTFEKIVISFGFIACLVNLIAGEAIITLIIVAVILFILLWNRFLNKIFCYRYNYSVPKWVRILVWIIFILIFALKFFKILLADLK